MASYSATDKFLHRFYLGNPSISRASLEMEHLLYGKKAKDWEVRETVFVTGLARSGTTGVMRKIFDTGEYASLQYSNMPFILSPNLWNRNSSIASHERAHNDGIKVDGNSPEEFDEYFWKTLLKDSFIGPDTLERHELNPEILTQYINYVKLICLAKGKHKYISKNNNSILRLDSLRKIPNSKMIVLFRDPVSHASSLMKLHLKFSEEQKKDPFTLEYFDYLGHYEFGLHHKPFALTAYQEQARKEFSPENINYWLLLWMNYYHFLLDNIEEGDYLISFEDLKEKPETVYSQLSKVLYGHPTIKQTEGFQTTTKLVPSVSEELVTKSQMIHEKLLERSL